ncbi:hypothetical protein [Lignipirellula cremea]|uniref:Uncharacterized protein n=1 Tax=Lignipirellula cremea TaxID=2528010 RepID=A0A518E1B0_9BACT|nr:hypothetical protein [Lignipirellula cremea]QDU97886.1 hypothetical protein Pla8534_57430 [Lignipirellula cremea]
MKTAWKTSLCTAVAVLAMSSIAPAENNPMHFAEMARTSEAIVVGTITQAGDRNDYQLHVDEVIVGSLQPGETIRVAQFRDWLCAWRWGPYQVDEKLLLFANYQATGDYWQGRGDSCECESPVVGDQIYANFPTDSRRLKYGKTHVTPFPRDLVRSAILELRPAAKLARAGELEPERPLFRDRRDAIVHRSPHTLQREARMLDSLLGDSLREHLVEAPRQPPNGGVVHPSRR